MYVCICNKITESQVRGVAGEPFESIEELYAQLGVRPKCGRCLQTAEELASEYRPVDPATLLAG